MKYFKPEDFVSWQDPTTTAAVANAKLQKLIEAAPVVYGYGVTPMASSLWNMNNSDQRATHYAKLMFIKPIEFKEPCKHEPNLLSQKIGGWFCKHCNIEIKATWEAVK